MTKILKKIIRKILSIPEKQPINSAIVDFIFKKILRQNSHVPWLVHYTSKVVCPENVKRGIGVNPGDSPGNYIQANNGIEIGDYTNLGPGVGIISANHDPVENDRHIPGQPVKIGKHCWIGMNAVILPGVELGDYVIVGAGAVVTKSFPSHVFIAGNPARIVKENPPPTAEPIDK